MLQTISQISARDPAHQAVIKAIKSHVLIVENSSQLTQLIAQELSYEGYQVSLEDDGISRLLAARRTNPPLIIVGWALPGISCIEFYRRLRSTDNDIPIIVLTPEGQVSERVMGLEAGASDCLQLRQIVDPIKVS